MAYIIPVERGATPLKQFVMSSLASAYFASSVAGAIFFGETVLVLLALCSQPVHVPGAYIVLASTALYLLYVDFRRF